ncbi:MAG TPA: DUF502 domain-containing protein [Longimicrobiales bacterium]|nr:DUF502 domain-containing protein [Longimicrobiales bacterium]
MGIYPLGEVTHNLVGRRVLQLGEEVLLRVPFVKVVCRAPKQVVTAFQKPNSAAFKSVALVEFPRKGMHSVGFLTNTFTQADGTFWHPVFVPTTPNPTTGFLEFLPAEDVIHTDLTVEDAFKLVMSLGVLTPERMGDLLAGRGTAQRGGPVASGVAEGPRIPFRQSSSRTGGPDHPTVRTSQP